ncbi:MAG TPA: flagellar motor switch protein FliG [Firmicutes bacterium]|nr:flagellar motor switch protein FliG [Bacillota bacterium]
MITDTSELTGKQKAAIIMVTLGPELSAQVFKHLNEDHMEQLTLEIANLRRVSPEVRRAVAKEFYQLCVARQYILEGGLDYARQLLERALGTSRAIEILSRLAVSLGTAPFDFVRNIDPKQLLSFIENEHPQTIALVVAHLKAEQAAAVLSGLPADLRADVAMRVATMDRTAPEVVRDVGKLLEERMASLGSEGFKAAGGVKTLVQVLNKVDRGTEKSILEQFEQKNPELAEEVKRLMFVFEDIIFLDDRSIQAVLREVDTKDLALALKAASAEVQEKIFKNMSERAASMLKEDMEFMGPVRLRVVEDAQQKIVNIIRKLEAAGEITIARGTREDEILV